MARKPRLHVSGGFYHVIARGNVRKDVLFTPANRSLFYDLLSEGVNIFGYRSARRAVQTGAATLEYVARQFNLSASTLWLLATILEKRSLASPDTNEALRKNTCTNIQA